MIAIKTEMAVLAKEPKGVQKALPKVIKQREDYFQMKEPRKFLRVSFFLSSAVPCIDQGQRPSYSD